MLKKGVGRICSSRVKPEEKVEAKGWADTRALAGVEAKAPDGKIFVIGGTDVGVYKASEEVNFSFPRSMRFTLAKSRRPWKCWIMSKQSDEE